MTISLSFLITFDISREVGIVLMLNPVERDAVGQSSICVVAYLMKKHSTGKILSALSLKMRRLTLPSMTGLRSMFRTVAVTNTQA